MKNKNMQCTFTLHDSSLKHQHNNSGSEFAPVGASSVLQRNLKEGLTVDSFSSVVLWSLAPKNYKLSNATEN